MKKVFVFLFALAGLQMSSQSQAICGGQTATLNAATMAFTLNPPANNYTLQPGGSVAPNGVFVITPASTTNYTIIASNGSTTQALPLTVTVNPQPTTNVTYTQLTCNTSTNGYNMGLTFLPASPVPSYTITWGNGGQGPPSIPNGWAQPQTSGSGSIAPGTYTAYITAAGGCSTTLIFTMQGQPASAQFTLAPSGASVYSLTCAQPQLTIAASNPTLQYTWANNISAPTTDTQVSVTFSDVSVFTVTAVHPVSGCVFTRTFAVVQNTVAPVANLTPTFQTITCSNPTPTNIVVTAVNPTVNFTHFIYSTTGAPWVANSLTGTFTPSADTYTYVFMNNVTGCTTSVVFTVSAGNSNFPTFTLTTPAIEFSVGCSTKSCVAVNIASAQTTPIAGGPVSYTMLAPNASTVTPPGALSSISAYTLCQPGAWTAIVKDNTTNCERRVTFSVLQNTSGPPLDTVYISQVGPGSFGALVNCYTPTVSLQGFSEYQNTSYVWSFPGTPGTQAGSSITVNSNTAAPGSSVVANYTLTMTDNNNLCTTQTVIPVYQNLYLPRPKVTTGGTFSLTCATRTIMLSNQSSTGIPPGAFSTNSLVVGWLWEGPTPQLPLQVSTSYVAGIAGIYTLTVQDYNNGCMTKTTVEVFDDRIVPQINQNDTLPVRALDCGSSSVLLTPSVATGSANLTYTWTGPPTASTSPKNLPSLSTNAPGNYSIAVTNTLNGCTALRTFSVINGSLTAQFSSDKTTGYAPLQVTFNNLSHSTNSVTGSESVTTIWRYGNNATITTTATSIQPVTVYNAPGTYTVMIFASKGSCTATASQTIQVEIPSHLTIPNIFTPNGDGVNDLYFLGTANVGSIRAEIYDRWGNLVYQIDSETGNIAWDGKNSQGKEVAEGVYFYVIRATGADGVTYDQKGSITLVR